MKITTLFILLISIMQFDSLRAEESKSVCSGILEAGVVSQKSSGTDNLVSMLQHPNKVEINNKAYTIEYRINQDQEPDCLFGVYSSLFISSIKHETEPNKEQIEYAINVNHDAFIKVILYSIKNLPYYADYFGAGVNLRESVQNDALNIVGISLLAEHIKDPLSHKSFQIQKTIKLDLVRQLPQETVSELEKTLGYFLSVKSGTIRLDIDAALATIILLHLNGIRYAQEELGWLYRQLEADFSHYDVEESVFFKSGMTESQTLETAKIKLNEFIAIYSSTSSPEPIKYPTFWAGF